MFSRSKEHLKEDETETAMRRGGGRACGDVGFDDSKKGAPLRQDDPGQLDFTGATTRCPTRNVDCSVVTCLLTSDSSLLR